MREPSARPISYAWWVAALAYHRENGSLRGFHLPVNENEPQVGFYKRKLVRGGPWVPARIWMHQVVDPETLELTEPEELRAEVDGKPADPHDVWPYVCQNPIPHAEFQFLSAHASWARSNAPHEAAANPERPVDLLTMAVPF